jgi:hypothetical protein
VTVQLELTTTGVQSSGFQKNEILRLFLSECKSDPMKKTEHFLSCPLQTVFPRICHQQRFHEIKIRSFETTLYHQPSSQTVVDPLA